MTEHKQRIEKLRHDLANPVSALLAETELLLQRQDGLDRDTVQSLQDIQALVYRMRSILREI